MEQFLLGARIGAWTALGGIIALAVIALIYVLAKNDVFFTFVEEGTAKVIMKFGGFHRIIMRYQNCTCERADDWEVKVIDTPPEAGATSPEARAIPPKKPKKGKGRFWGGLYKVGIPGIHSIYKYNFRWATVKPGKQPGEQVERREERIGHIFVKDYVYYARISEAETAGLVPLDIEFLVTMRVVNPYKALFRVHDWVNAIVARIEAYFRQYVAETEYQDLITRKQQMAGDIMEQLGQTGMLEEVIPDPDDPETDLKKKRKITRPGTGKFWQDYGIHVKNIEMREISPAGENKKAIQEAATKEWVANRQKLQVLTLADAEVQRVGRVYGKIREFGEDGLHIRTLEALESAGGKAGNWVAFPFNLLGRLFRDGERK